MADTYTLISSVTVGAGGASSIDFTSIPATYTDLIVKLSLRSSYSAAIEGVKIVFNNDTVTAITAKRLYGNGASAVSDSGGNPIFMDGATATSNTFANIEIYVPNYAGGTYKSFSVDEVQENNNSTAYAGMIAGLFNGTAAINRITLSSENAANFVQYSTAYLYGIKNS